MKKGGKPAAVLGALTREQHTLVLNALDQIRILARRLARRRPWIEAEELLSEALLAASEKARTYDPSVGQPFMAYAIKRIRGAMRNKANKELRIVMSRADAIEDTFEMEEREGVDAFVDTQEAAREHVVRCLRTFADEMVVAAFADASAQSKEVNAALQRALAALDKRELQVVELRIFDGLEQKAVADRIGRSERTVRRLEQDIVARLRASLLQQGVAATPPTY